MRTFQVALLLIGLLVSSGCGDSGFDATPGAGNPAGFVAADLRRGFSERQLVSDPDLTVGPGDTVLLSLEDTATSQPDTGATGSDLIPLDFGPEIKVDVIDESESVASASVANGFLEVVSEADGDGVDLVFVSFLSTDSGGVDILIREGDCAGCDLSGADLSDLDLSGVDLTNTVLNGVNFKNSQLEGATLSRARGDRASFQGASLRESKLDSVILRSSNFQDADLTGATAPTSNFSDSNFERARLNLIQAPFGIFQGAILRDAALEGASLSRASFAFADLSGASFRNADLSYANLAGADLTGADFLGADRTGVRYR